MFKICKCIQLQLVWMQWGSVVRVGDLNAYGKGSSPQCIQLIWPVGRIAWVSKQFLTISTEFEQIFKELLKSIFPNTFTVKFHEKLKVRFQKFS